MPYAKVENGVVVMKSFRPRPGWVAIPDEVVCGYVYDNGSFRMPDPSPEQEAVDLQAWRNNQEAHELLADNKFQAIINKTPQQCLSWARSSFPSLTLAEQRDIGTLVQCIAILGRQL
jgi:hypothetical protein